MKLMSFVTPDDRSTYGVATETGVIDLAPRLGVADLRELLASDDWRASIGRHAGAPIDFTFGQVRHRPVIPNPGKVVCVGLNYEDHRLEAGLPRTDHPALFLRTADSQTAHLADMVRPRESESFDYEAELAVVIGRPGRRIAPSEALDHVAGYACYNDGSVRLYQRHTQQYTAGKIFPQTGSFGPWMVTTDDIRDPFGLDVSCRLNGERVQHANTDQMIFSVPELIAYISTATPLSPGDVIVTGTPAGVGSRRSPQLWMKPGDRVEVEIEGIGLLANTIADD